VGASIFTHLALVGITLYLSNLNPSRQMPQFASTTVNLVNLDDMGGGGNKILDAKPAKGGETLAGEKPGDSPSDKHASKGKAKTAPLAPVKRLQLDEPAAERKLEKRAAPEVPDVPKRAIQSVDDDVEKLIPKPKLPEPQPVAKAKPPEVKPQPAAPKPQPVETRKPATSPQPAPSAKAAETHTPAPAPAPKNAQLAQAEGAPTAKPGPAKGSTQATQSGGSASAQSGANPTATQPGMQPGTPGGSGGASSGSGAGPGTSGVGRGTAAGPGSGQEGGGAQNGAALNAYALAVNNAIKEAWMLTPNLKSQELEVALIVLVRKDGKVVDIKVDRNSGNSAFDESAVRAVRRAEPLPAFPEIFGKPELEFYIRFTPRGLS
jgi:TonB family protein